MPARTIASQTHRTFFSLLSGIALVFGAKPATDAWSINLHGTFELHDKDWGSQTKENPRETLLAMRDVNGKVPLTRPEGEPLVHLHVDWTAIRWARLEPQELPLIGTDRAISFYARQETPRLFAFYCKGIDIDRVMALGDWVMF